MNTLFLSLLNMSIAAGWSVLAVLVLRLLLRKAPKWITCLLWAIPALRLLIPVFWESGFSLLPSAQVIPTDIAQAETPIIYSGLNEINSTVNPVLTQQADSLAPLLKIAVTVWLAGLGIMLLYSLISWLYLRFTVRVSMQHSPRVYLCDQVKSPFIFGLIRPRIYLPSGLDQSTMEHVLSHEQAHLRRLDHLWKPLGYLLLSIYWFNPLLWVAYILLCRDIERACDEQVLRNIDEAGRLRYAKALVDCSTHRRMILTCPVAFGEVGIKSRVKAILNYKKPVFWIVVAALIASIVAAVCFLTNPKACEHNYRSEITVSATCIQEGVETHTCPLCDHSYTQAIAFTDHTYEPGAVEKEPTCTVTGEQQYTCTVCGATKREPVEKLPHQLENITITKESNCTEEGECVGTCSQCGDPAAIGKLPTNDAHVFTNTVVRAATCTQPGEGINTCSLCQHSEPCQYPITDHTYETKTVLKKTTCTKDGAQEVVCTQCQQTETVAVPAPGHQWEGATCTKAGVCSVCNATGSKASHSYQIISEKKPSKDFAGIRVKECKTCGKEKSEYTTKSYTFDLDSIASQLVSYAKKCGFQARIHKPTNPEFKLSMAIADIDFESKGPDWFVKHGKRCIDNARDDYGADGEPIDYYTVDIYVYYADGPNITWGLIGVYIDIVN